SGRIYDLVAERDLTAFRRRALMTEDVFEKVAQPQDGMVNVRVDDVAYAATVEHFGWFFFRFLLEDQKRGDFDFGGGGVALGGRLLDFLVVQLQLETVDAIR